MYVRIRETFESAESAALEQVVLDVEAWIHARAFLRTFSVDEETLGFDAISKAGPGGNFLGIKHTLEHFQQEIWLKKETTILESSKSGSLVERAKEKIRQILSKHVPPQLDEEVQREINQILRDCEKNTEYALELYNKMKKTIHREFQNHAFFFLYSLISSFALSSLTVRSSTILWTIRSSSSLEAPAAIATFLACSAMCPL